MQDQGHHRQGGGPDRIAKQHQSGKLTARERIEKLVIPAALLKSTLLCSTALMILAWIT